jgi:prepilin-type N-terminal cleavage/methylation domain-containing protein
VKKFTMTRSKGFTLIELLVVVAIISIIASIGFVAYSGYVESAKKKTAENAMMQLSLAQTEYYSENSVYYASSGSATDCTPNSNTTKSSQDNLIGGTELFTSDLGYNVCIVTDTSKKYYIIAKEEGSGATCKLKLDGNLKFYPRENC